MQYYTQNVETKETVFTIIPYNNKEIIGEGKMPLPRSEKEKVGQKVNIRLINFSDNEYGIIKGKVKFCSIAPVKDAQGTPYYTVEIELPQGLKTTYNNEMPYSPDIQAQTNIITENISLLERFFMQKKKILSEGMIN